MNFEMETNLEMKTHLKQNQNWKHTYIETKYLHAWFVFVVSDKRLQSFMITVENQRWTAVK